MQDTTFAANLRSMRARTSLNQTALGRLIGLGQGVITKWETGRSTPSVDQLILLAAALDTTAAELLAGCAAKTQPVNKSTGAPRASRTRATAKPGPKPEPPVPVIRRTRAKVAASVA